MPGDDLNLQMMNRCFTIKQLKLKNPCTITNHKHKSTAKGCP